MSANMPLYSRRLTLVTTLGTPFAPAYMEMTMFSSSMPVRVTTASVAPMPSLSSSALEEPSPSTTAAFGSCSAKLAARAGLFSMIFTLMPALSRRSAR